MLNTHSPRSESITNAATAAVTAGGGGGGDGGGGSSNSPQSRRRSLPSPWAQVVRGEPEASSSPSPSLPAAATAAGPLSPSSLPPPPIASSAPAAAAVPEQGSNTVSSSDSSGANAQAESSVDNGGNVAPPRRPAWNRPVNGVVEPVSVMGGAVSWPALSESTRPGSRSTQDSSRPISNGSSSASQGQVIHQSTQRQVSANANANSNAHPNANAHANANANPNSNANHATPGRHRSIRHRGGSSNNHNGGGSAHGGFNRPPPPPPPPLPPPFPVIEIPYGNMVPPVVMDSSIVGPRPMGGMRPQSHGPNDHSSQRNSSRRGNFGPRPRGDGSYHNNHGGRRDQDRRDGHMQQFVHPTPAFIPPPPPGTPPYGPPLPMRPFPGPMGFDMASPLIYVPTFPPESFRGVPLIAQAPPPPVYYPVMEPPLPVLIVNQIDYYFSDENLVKDDFLRSNMDDEGWVPIGLIANFPRVAHLTSSTEFILECLKASKAVDIQGDKVRRRDDWRRWIHTPARHNGESDSHSTGESSDNALVNSVQNISLGDATSSRNNSSDAVDAQTDSVPSARSTGEFTGRSEMANGDGTAEAISSSQSQTLVA